MNFLLFHFLISFLFSKSSILSGDDFPLKLLLPFWQLV
nr:MAG TPA: hypothetical protein [Caudoviricetes sp.]